MGKNETLTPEQMASFKPGATTVAKIKALLSQSGKRPAGFRILDWGCGRGRLVAWLMSQGFDAYGVDIDRAPLNKSSDYFSTQGSADRLRLLDSSGRAPFDDSFFDCVISQQVLEHVRDLRAVATEIHRVTRKGGTGFHIFPAHKRLVEGHLYMPLIHWIPKGTFRRSAIRAWTFMGIEPRWPQYLSLSAAKRADEYYDYSINRTFYRTPKHIVSTFDAAGMSARIVSGSRPALSKFGFLVTLRKTTLGSAALNSFASNFLFVDLETERR